MRAEGGLGREAPWARGEHEVPGQEKRIVGPRTVRPPIRDSAGSLSGGTHPPGPPWGGTAPPAPREPTMRPGRPRRRRRNAGADPLGHRSFMESA
jgi:hypothetical protein